MPKKTTETQSAKQLPTGIQTFAKLREGDYYYVDKTPLIVELCKETAVFLSRPRRFGKSLTLSTIAALFSGQKALFTGLYAESHWDWSQTNPVIAISFGSGDFSSLDKLEQSLDNKLRIVEKSFALTSTTGSLAERLTNIIHHCQQQSGQKVVILIDEYDKPMLDNLHDSETLIAVRQLLRAFYNVIKDNDAYIRFAMLTGVSKFSKVNLFSGLNNLTDITLEKHFSAICGYTQDELETVFVPELHNVDLDKLKHWYNGYNWGGEAVYNPFDILLFLREKNYKSYWFETGTPTFLIEQLVGHKKTLYNLEKGNQDGKSLAQFDVGNFEPIALMFQTGYLTIDKVQDFGFGVRYRLKYPNIEVQQSLNQIMLSQFLPNSYHVLDHQFALYECLSNNDFDTMQQLLNGLFSAVPHDWYRNNTIAHYEGHWASMFYAFFASIGVDISCEDSSNHGQIDMSVQCNHCVYLFEFKVVEIIDQNSGETVQQYPTGKALQQIKDNAYADKYRHLQQPIYLIGVEFSEQSRDIVHFSVEQVNQAGENDRHNI